jgi:hypothetical protein
VSGLTARNTVTRVGVVWFNAHSVSTGSVAKMSAATIAAPTRTPVAAEADNARVTGPVPRSLVKLVWTPAALDGFLTLLDQFLCAH